MMNKCEKGDTEENGEGSSIPYPSSIGVKDNENS